MNQSIGKVYLVGAGPGDPGLLTLRGRELLGRADVVIYDTLVNEALLSFARDAELVFAGKQPSRQPLKQDDIQRLLIEYARRVACVVRLKGGDPCVYGRAGEEALALKEAGVPFEIVPGVTAGIGAPAYAGIPVTHRGSASSVTFLTGHEDFTETGTNLKLDRLHLDGTLVIFMARTHLETNLRELVRLGRSATTPAAAIQWGTLPKQQTVTGDLSDLAQRCNSAGLHTPLIVVVGEVVNLRETISWFEARPLFGRRIVVTRDRERAYGLTSRLLELGAEVLEFPTIEIVPVDHAGVPRLDRFDWIVVASVNGVDALVQHMAAQGLDARALHGCRICAISRRTAQAFEERWIRPDVMPGAYEPGIVAGEMEAAGGALKGRSVLMPRADIGRSELPRVLENRGADVTELQAYRTGMPTDSAAKTELLTAFRPDCVVFGSGASARHFAAMLGDSNVSMLTASTDFAAIGPRAANAASQAGMHVHIEPEEHSINGLVSAIVEHYRAR